MGHAFQNTIVEVSVPPQGRLELVSPDRYDAVYSIAKECFVDDEPLGKSIGLEWTKDLEEVWKDTLSHNLSVILVNEDNGDIMGFRNIRVTTKGEHWDNNAFQDDNLKKLFSFFAYSSNSFNIFERFDLQEVFEFFGLGVAKKYRQRGIGAFLIEFAVKFVQNLGINPCFIKSTATSNFSKKIFENAGFEFLAEFPYETYTVNGEIVFSNTGEHKSMKMYKRSF